MFLPAVHVSASTQNFAILSHYQHPPYVTSTSDGLTFELANYLTRKSGGRYRFQSQILPKRRLLNLLRSNTEDALVPWVTPEWMPEAISFRPDWSDTIMESNDLVISSQQKPLEWQGPVSASGLRFGGILGHVYTDLMTAFAQGTIIRDDAPDDASNLMKLRKQRIDFLFLQDHAVQYYLHRHPALMADLYISKSKRNSKPHQLKIMLRVRNEADKSAILLIINRMPQDAEWQSILKRYGLGI
nr:transporter substrate-binding domain-containing protein [Undibacterium squillarum]